MKKFLHPSFLTVSFCLGILSSIFFAHFIRVDFFSSPLWTIVVLLCFAYACIYSTKSVLILTFFAGAILGFCRTHSGLDGKTTTPEQWFWVAAIRDWLHDRVMNTIGEPEANLGVAYLLGIKDDLPKLLSTNLKLVGLTHIVVASGTHLSILTDLVKKIMGRISRFGGLFFSLVFIFLFIVMTGWTPSILRAGIMSGFSMLAWYVGRRFAPWRIILITATISLLFEPDFLTNLGWLFSFTSFIGIAIVGPEIKKFFYGSGEPNFVASMIITSVSATLLTLPLTLYFFGSFSLISVVANILILPTLPFVMVCTLLSGLLSDIPIIGNIFSFSASLILKFHIFVIDFFAAQTYFVVKIPISNPYIFLLYPAVLIPVFIYWVRRWILKRKYVKIN